MMDLLGEKIAGKRKDLGMTQTEFAEKMAVTRQTVSRWEAGAVLPDIDKISDIARILGVSCDYLLKDEISSEPASAPSEASARDVLEASGASEASVRTAAGCGPVRSVGRLLESLTGQQVRLSFFEDEADADLYNTVCRVIGFEGNWMKIEADLKKGRIEKLIPVSSVCSIELVKEDD